MGNALPTSMRLSTIHAVLSRILRRLACCHWSLSVVITFVVLVVHAPVLLADSGLPIPFVGSGSDGEPRITVVGPDGVARLSVIHDFEDVHTFQVIESIRSNECDGSGAVQFVNVLWLDQPREEVGRKSPNYRIPRPAEALWMRDWQNTGMDGGSLESRASQDVDDSPISGGMIINDVEQSNRFGITYGVGMLEIEHRRRTDIQASILGDGSYLANDLSNQIFGPKAGLVWNNSRGPISFDFQSSLLLGINSGEITDTSKFGDVRSPTGALNRLLYMSPTYSSRTYERQAVSPVGELRAQSRLRLTKALSLSTTWSTLLVGNLFQETSELRTGLPEPSFLVDNENLLVHQFYCGAEYVY